MKGGEGYNIKQDYEYTDSLENFVNTIDSPYTEKTYKNSLKLYIKYHDLKETNYDSLLKIDRETTFKMIRDFIVYQRKEKQRSHSRINIFFLLSASFILLIDMMTSIGIL